MQPAQFQMVMVVAIVVTFIACIGIHRELLFQVMIHQRAKMMPIVSFSGGGFQAGDHTRLGIQTDMGFVAKKVFGLFDFFAVLSFDLAFVLGSPAGIWIMRPFAFLFPLFVFGGIHIGDAVHTVDNLD